jgi:eukaryotic-like serine/threonine-protein kinase
MDTARRERIDAIHSEPATLGHASVEQATEADLIDSIAVDAVTIPKKSEDAPGSHQHGEVCQIPSDGEHSPLEDQIGPYQVRALIGSGHVGSVYRASRDPELSDQVVVKLIQCGADKDTILKRFQSEKHVHAALRKHPNIAALLEAGITDDGRAFLVMDYIEGQHIDRYCDERRVDVPNRVKLFSQVCEAVHFAHQHEMLHRNLKPSNILVTAEGLPKVLDVGIAKLVQPDVTGQDGLTALNTSLTGTGEPVLTAEYASPEQVTGEGVTTASDVYMLGVVLYQLLTGRWPYRVLSRSRPDILQAICEQLPEKPSAAVIPRPADRASKSADSLGPSSPTPEDIASARGLAPWELSRKLKGDLDSIVLMALQKEPERRYPSVEHLREDLISHLRGMPIRARSHSALYRTSKLIRRHTIAVATGLLFLLLFLTSSIALMRGFLAARNERDQTEKSLRQARQTVDQIFTSISEDRLLEQPAMHPLRQAVLLDAQRFYDNYLNQQITNPQPLAEQATVQTHIAKVSSLLGSKAKSIVQFQQAVALWETLVEREPDNLEYHASLAQSLDELGVMLLPQQDRLTESLNLFLHGREIMERLVAIHPELPAYRIQLGHTVLNIAEIKGRQGKLDEAIDLVEHALEIESQLNLEGSESLEPRIALATAHATLGKFLKQSPADLPAAIASYQQAVELREAVTRQHPQLVDQSYQLALELSSLGDLERELGQSASALEHLSRSLHVFERITEMCPGVTIYQDGFGTTCNTTSDLERKQGNQTEALAWAEKARKLFDRLVAENPENASYRRGLAQSYNNLGRLQSQAAEIAAPLRSFQRAVDLYESLPELDAHDSYNLACNIALCISLLTRKNTAQSGPQELTKGDRLRCQIYGDRAIESLRRSFKGGFLTPQILEDDTDLDALRGRIDFKALLKEIEETPITNSK